MFKKIGIWLGILEEVEEPKNIPPSLTPDEMIANLKEFAAGTFGNMKVVKPQEHVLHHLHPKFRINDEEEVEDRQGMLERRKQEYRLKKKLENKENNKWRKYFKQINDGYDRRLGRRIQYLNQAKLPVYNERFHGSINDVEKEILRNWHK